VSIVEAVFVIIAALFLIVLARWVLQWIFGYTLHDILTDHDNPAMGLAVAGYLFGVIWTITVLLSAPSRGLWRDILDVLLYGALGIILLTAVALVSCRFFLGLHVREQLEAHNVAAAIVVAGAYVATSVTYSGGLSGEGGGFWVLLLFFILGQLALLGLTHVFRLLTGYDDIQQIASGNVAAALALAGLLIALGVIVGHAAAGVFVSLGASLLSFLLALLVAVVFYPVRQLVVQCLILGGPVRWRGTLLDHEIATDKNIAAGLLEATAYLSTALFITYMT
jgi:uncharacterized membrane protein YjfL (UPF0719 family)